MHFIGSLWCSDRAYKKASANPHPQCLWQTRIILTYGGAEQDSEQQDSSIIIYPCQGDPEVSRGTHYT